MHADDFLARVRAALGRPDGDAPAPPAVDDALVRRCGPDDDLAARFAEAAERTGMAVHRCRAASLAATIAGVLESCGARTATLSATRPSVLEAAGTALGGAGRAVDWNDADGLESHYEADAGVTDVEAAIAETGSIVITSAAGRSRGAFLVPPVHVAVVEAAQIVPDLLDFWSARAAADPATMPAATVTVTGPSKTADIEGILITGVHGPREVHVILVESVP
ncbi:MAG: LutC/YkgG family protein [Planctomycetota bacterium]|jgi:L-lactate dehydrogenase complex protein LldG